MNKGYKIYEENGKRIIAGEGYYKQSKINDLKELVNMAVEKYGDKTGFKFKDNNGKIIEKSYNEFGRSVNSLGTSLISMGLKGSNIAILSENRYEWGICYFSIVNGTGTVVPLDKYLSFIEIKNLIDRGNVEAIFYSPTFAKNMLEIASGCDIIKYYISIDDNPNKVDKRFISVNELIKNGEELINKGNRDYIDSVIDGDKLSVLLFTSGTTSISKGVMLSHKNIANNVTALTTIIKVYPDDVHLSLLPLHHTFENTIGLLFMIHSGVCIAYSEGIKYVAKNLKEYNISIIVAVPAIFEAMYKKVQEGIKKAGKENLVNIMITISNILRVIRIDIRKRLFKAIIRELSPKLRILVSGAAPIDPRIIIGYSNLGLKVVQGYGLTETSPVICATNDFLEEPYTVGYPVKDVEVAIDSPDEVGIGEIMTRSKCVMMGYYKDDLATREAIDEEGWFKTGDLGVINNKGLLRITGRMKSMIVLTNGKKAFTEEYEKLLNNYNEIKDSFIWGYKTKDGDIQICAKIVIDDNYSRNDKKAISGKINEIIKELNAQLPKYKVIRYYILTFEELIKTTTLKIKRKMEDDRINLLLKKTNLEMRKISGKFIEDLE